MAIEFSNGKIRFNSKILKTKFKIADLLKKSEKTV
jgi:hypothetical protein